jgi:hypothetical protein
MPPKFGNYLFRNLKSGSGSSEKDSTNSAGPVEDQEIVLQPEDFTSEIGGALNWASQAAKEIRVKLRQTDGLMDGRVTISAKILRELYPDLVPDQLQADTTFPLSLRSVVLQLQNVMRSPKGGPALAGAPDFDTPIAQVAREDEGFFKLEENACAPAANPPAAVSADDFGSVLPLIREKEQVREDPASAPPVQVVPPVAPQKPQRSQNDPPADSGLLDVVSRPAPRSQDPFADLPKPKAPSLKTPPAVNPSPVAGNAKLLNPESQKPQRRRGLELLQELFLTDDFLDAGQVAQLLRGFPKVRAALIMLEDGTVLGGDLPENYRAGAALPAPALMRAVREFGTQLSSAEVSAFTVLADSPISVFLEGRVCLLVVHEGRGLLPGMRERFSQVTKALDALYYPGDKEG